MYDDPEPYAKVKRQNVTKVDTEVNGPSGTYTVRRWFEKEKFFRADVYLGGRWVGGYKTEKGITQRVNR